MKRTAADFADDARDGELYELELADGTTIKPRSRWDLSYEEDAEELANRARWFQWHEDHPGKVPPVGIEVEGQPLHSPDQWMFRARLGADYDAWWAEWKDAPTRRIAKLFAEVDEFYDPTPASEREKDAATAGDLDAVGKSGSASTS